jgi:chromosome-anchoring protein RacA
MNTSEVSKLLGVSSSTIQRWVKQLELPMEKNERGHYYFTDADIAQLKKIHEQLQNGTLLHEITPDRGQKNLRKGAIKTGNNDESLEKVWKKVNDLERTIHTKADSVTSYQLLQHRREIEELQKQVNLLTNQLEELQEKFKEMKTHSQIDKSLILDTGKVKRKKKNIVSSFFGILP